MSTNTSILSKFFYSLIESKDKECAELYDLLEFILDLSTQEELQSFTNIRSKYLYKTKKHQISESLNKAMIKLINTYYHNLEISENEFTQYLLNLYKLTKIVLYPEFHLDYFNDLQLATVYQTESVDFPQCQAFMLKFKSLETLKTKYGHVLIKIEGYTEDEKLIDVYLWEEKQTYALTYGKRISLFAELLFPNCKISFENFKYSEVKQAFVQTSESIVVIEPDFLIDASALAECNYKDHQFSPEIWFMKLFYGFEFSEAILKGKIVNQILDNIINKIPEDPIVTLKEIVNQNLLNLLLLGEFSTAALLYEVQSKHLPNIEKLMIDYKQGKMLTEPSFISPRYGLQGRLDALIEFENDPLEKVIFELKSGKAPHTGVRSEHLSQVVCYDLLMRSVWGEHRVGHSMVFYSSAELNALRNAPIYKTHIENLLMCRNVIVSEVFRSANSDYFFLERFLKLNQQDFGFKKEAYMQVKRVFQEISEIRYQYYKCFVSFMLGELVSEKTGLQTDNYDYGFSALWNLSYIAKNKGKLIFDNLKFHEKRGKLVTLTSDSSNYSLNFREGDPVIIYAKNEHVSGPLKTYLIKANFISHHDKLIIISLKNELANLRLFQQTEYFVLEKDIMEFSDKSVINSLFDFCQEGEQKINKFFGLTVPESDYIAEENKKSSHEIIINKAISAKDYFIIQGPPGTGKTSKIIMGLIKALLQKDKLPIVILAFTNRAVDEIIHRMEENNFKYLSIGSRRGNSKYHINSILSENIDNSIANLKENRIFVSTVASFHNDGKTLLKIINSGTLIVDEASQLLEPQLAGLVIKFNKWILIGDHYQLPAVSTQSNISAPQLLQEQIGLLRLNDSLFERMIRLCKKHDWDQAWGILTEHYRMHQDIAELINPYYENCLHTGNIIQNEEISQSTPTLLFESRRVFFPCISSFQHKTNLREAQLTVDIIKMYQDRGLQHSFGIICNWKAQANLIQQLLLQEDIKLNYLIDTVERFQGSERDIIIYSSALNSQKQLTRVSLTTFDNKVDRKLNVAISRAKKQFCLLGDPDILKESSHYKYILDLMKWIDVEECEDGLRPKK